jgi:hypothetical protein
MRPAGRGGGQRRGTKKQSRLAEHPDHPDAGDIRVQHDRYRSDYFRFKRALLGWAIFVGRKV